VINGEKESQFWGKNYERLPSSSRKRSDACTPGKALVSGDRIQSFRQERVTVIKQFGHNVSIAERPALEPEKQ
jgi:hypothetical protein